MSPGWALSACPTAVASTVHRGAAGAVRPPGRVVPGAGSQPGAAAVVVGTRLDDRGDADALRVADALLVADGPFADGLVTAAEPAAGRLVPAAVACSSPDGLAVRPSSDGSAAPSSSRSPEPAPGVPGAPRVPDEPGVPDGPGVPVRELPGVPVLDVPGVPVLDAAGARRSGARRAGARRAGVLGRAGRAGAAGRRGRRGAGRSAGRRVGGFAGVGVGSTATAPRVEPAAGAARLPPAAAPPGGSHVPTSTTASAGRPGGIWSGLAGARLDTLLQAARTVGPAGSVPVWPGRIAPAAVTRTRMIGGSSIGIGTSVVVRKTTAKVRRRRDAAPAVTPWAAVKTRLLGVGSDDDRSTKRTDLVVPRRLGRACAGHRSGASRRSCRVAASVPGTGNPVR